MVEKGGRKSYVVVNRAPVAEVLGFEHDEALTVGRAVAGLFKPFIMGKGGPLIFSPLSTFFRGSWEVGIIGSGGGDG
jgi:hypothetical protein